MSPEASTDRSLDHLGSIVELRLLPAVGERANGQAEVVDERLSLVAQIGAASATSLEQVVFDEFGESLANRDSADVVFAGRVPRCRCASRFHSPASIRRRMSAAIWK